MRLFLDACAIIYLVESYQQQGQQTRRLVAETLQDKTPLFVSTLSFLECRISPLRKRNDELLAKYHQFFKLPNVQLVQLTEDVINIATDLRVNYSNALRTPDALQLACALKVNANRFLTGDKKLSVIQEIQVLIV